LRNPQLFSQPRNCMEIENDKESSPRKGKEKGRGKVSDRHFLSRKGRKK